MSVVIATLAKHPYTAIFVNRQGEVAEVIPLDQDPTPEIAIELMRSHPKMSMSFRAQGLYPESEITKIVRSSLEGFEIFDTGKLPPGVRAL
jgi:hypothetical protein